ncbi:hypothetical protein LTR37_010117 [Vermiconidia calcicola]|uniref:Uncharacterized protein n=1 Tax=Vermiconidia calcicola TaxID=1690605 RepID=A0ACC3N5X9_9PEZI|nr:hypothetical protein LTR37_010117 [Vermiconidia calcicola]
MVKLEGESRTRLLSPAGPNGEKPRPQLEYHKILYKIQCALPQADADRFKASGKPASFTLSLGTHEYPFSFKLPFNNSCASDKSQMATTMRLSSIGPPVEVTKPPPGHVKKTLPPTMSGFPGEAEIRYFVKATVKRHAFWKENPRAYVPFNFFPIEPPRPARSENEIFARQRHFFSPFPSQGQGVKAKTASLFDFGKAKAPPSPSVDGGPPEISVDARLPEPAILTCNKDVPLRLIVKKLNDSNAVIQLESLQVSLIGNTKIRAHDVFRTESSSWVLMSQSNMSMPLCAAVDPAHTEMPIPDHLWRGQTLPNTVAPSFETCNISRSYQLDVRVGLSYTGGLGSTSKVRKGQIPQTVVLPLRLDTTVFSGIAPPQELLEAMAQAKADPRPKPSNINTSALDEKLRTEGRNTPTASAPATPLEGPSSSRFPVAQPAQPPLYGDAPPSYEDAVASNLPPLDAPRPDYAPPPAAEDDVLGGDEKKGFGRTRDS